MTELKEGMYVRTKSGRLHKITRIVPFYENEELIYDEQYLYIDNKISGYRVWQFERLVKKASYNIIDLIEVGDYVNGMKVNNIAIEDGLIYLHMDADECLHEDTMLTGDDIKSIVTKEQFESMKYRVEE